jgi:two-component system response regulator MprA
VFEAPPKTVLLVDDNAAVRACYGGLLRAAGYAVATAAAGAAALAWLRSNPPPWASVLDLSMPVMGWAAFRAAQLADLALAAIPVVVHSGDADVQAALTAAAVWRKGDDPAGVVADRKVVHPRVW